MSRLASRFVSVVRRRRGLFQEIFGRPAVLTETPQRREKQSSSSLRDFTVTRYQPPSFPPEVSSAVQDPPIGFEPFAESFGVHVIWSFLFGPRNMLMT